MSNNFGVNGIIFLSLFFLIMKENLNSKEFFVKLPNLKVSITVIVHQGIWYLCILIIFQILVILNILILKNITFKFQVFII